MAQGDKPGDVKPIGGGKSAWARRIQQLGQQAEQDVQEGALTPSYKANHEEVLDLLNRALAGEWASFLQYYHHYTMASGMSSPAIAAVWKEHAEEEYEHARRINARISQLGGVPANSPEKIAQLSPLPFREGHDMESQLRDDLIFERATIGFYDEIVRTCAFDDITTRRLFESLVADENEHAEELSSFLFELDASTGQQVESTERPEMRQRRAA